MEGPGERLCVGEPERLSLDDWWKPEEKLRLLCMGGGGVCLDSFFRMLRRLLWSKTRCQVCQCFISTTADWNLMEACGSL